MKAVIMAGGMGKRLSPVTDLLPKPLAPIGGVPCIKHIISLLKKHGITDIGISLMYKGELIREALGDCRDVNIRFFEESTPMGTAGSVKNCSDFLDGDFLVISGDCLCDFDLSEAIDFHAANGGVASIVFTRVKEPLEYGVALLEEDFRVSRFIEKPSWSRAYSDTVNTGIYLFSRRIFDYIRLKDSMCDFSKDVFPLMMKENVPIYGKLMDGYWCDIGDCRAYLQANIDYASGKIQSPLWSEAAFGKEKDAFFYEPCIVGKDSEISGAVIGPNTVIGSHCRIGRGARIENSVLMDGVTVGENASVRFGVVCPDCRIENGASVGEFSVIGKNCRVGRGAVVAANTKIHADNEIPENAQISGNIFTYCGEPTLDGGKMVFPRIEFFDSSHYMKAGAAFGTVLHGNIAVGISASDCLSSEMSFNAGLVGTGCGIFDMGECSKNMLRYTVRKYGFRGGVFFSCDEKETTVWFFESDGLPPGRNTERDFERVFSSGDIREGKGSLRPFDGFKTLYRRHIKALLGRQRPIKALVIAPTVLSEHLIVKNARGLERIFVGEDEIFVRKISADGRSEQAYTPEQVKAVLTYVFGYFFGKVYLPYHYPFICDEVARRNGFSVERLTLESENRRLMYEITDMDIAAAILFRYLSLKQCSFGEILACLPSFSSSSRTVDISGGKAAIMRGLSEESRQDGEFVEGIRLFFPGKSSGVLIVPEKCAERFRLYAEAESLEAADEICNFYEKKINGRKTGK